MSNHNKSDQKGLSAKAHAFVTEYIRDFNGTRAAIAAGYSPRSARCLAVRLLHDPRVQAKLTAFRQDHEHAAALSFDKRAQILSQIARATMADFVTVTAPGIVAINPITEHNQAALAVMDQRVMSEEQGGGLVTRVKLRDPIAAIRELNEMFGDHAPRRRDARLTGTIENLSDDALKAELDKLDKQEAVLAAGRAKMVRGIPGPD